MPHVAAATESCRRTATTGSGSIGLVFDQITMPMSCRVGAGDDSNGAATVAHYISTLLNTYQLFDVM